LLIVVCLIFVATAWSKNLPRTVRKTLERQMFPKENVDLMNTFHSLPSIFLSFFVGLFVDFIGDHQSLRIAVLVELVGHFFLSLVVQIVSFSLFLS
jgi:hypothetical protein